ncbi:MAG: hypothetical protein KGQ35_11920 [Burkholderiales bacterium]|nr:hypothetical protein [Burkholderiales bacterium]
MSKREDLKVWVKDALRRHGGEAKLLDVAKDIWKHHETGLLAAGDLYFTWQYDMRWAAISLRKDGHVEEPGKRETWKLVPGH